MADYQEYRRRVLHRRWRRRFMAAGLLFLLVLLGAVSVMWKRLHRDPAQTRQDTILQEITEDNTWNTLQYASTRPLTVQTLSTGTTTALDFRMAALPRTAPACRVPCSAPTGGWAPMPLSTAPAASGPTA